MLNTFIKNKGISKTIIHNNNKNYYNEIDWDADYDGEIANLSVNMNENGRTEHFITHLNNNELSGLFNIPSVSSTLDKRLYNDFLNKRTNIIPREQKMVLVYKNPKKKTKNVDFVDSIELIEPNDQKYTHISSPLTEENLLFPLEFKIAKKPKKRNKTKKHKKHKKHNTYRNTFRNKTNHILMGGDLDEKEAKQNLIDNLKKQFPGQELSRIATQPNFPNFYLVKEYPEGQQNYKYRLAGVDRNYWLQGTISKTEPYVWITLEEFG
jgi:hypothetical protein